MVLQTFLLISCVLTGFLAVAFAIVSRAHQDTNFYTKVPMIPLLHMPPLLPLTAVNTGYSAAGRAGLSAAARREFGTSPSALLVLSYLPPYRARSPAGLLLCDHPGQVRAARALCHLPQCWLLCGHHCGPTYYAVRTVKVKVPTMCQGPTAASSVMGTILRLTCHSMWWTQLPAFYEVINPP